MNYRCSAKCQCWASARARAPVASRQQQLSKIAGIEMSLAQRTCSGVVVRGVQCVVRRYGADSMRSIYQLLSLAYIILLRPHGSLIIIIESLYLSYLKEKNWQYYLRLIRTKLKPYRKEWVLCTYLYIMHNYVCRSSTTFKTSVWWDWWARSLARIYLFFSSTREQSVTRINA